MTTDLLERLQLRCVTEGDYDKVMAVRENVYGGYDYLPSCFFSLIKSANTLAFAAELDGKFIAFSIAFIIDDGQTCVERANRVSEEYEGRGVMRWLQQHAEAVVKERTSIKYVTYTTGQSEESTHRQLKLGKCYCVGDRDMKHFTIKRSEFNCVMQNFQCNDVSRFQQLNGHSLEQVLDTTELVNHLCGAERIMINYVPYRPIKSNIPLMIDDNTSAIGSNLYNDDTALLTFCFSNEVVHGMRYIIDVYGSLDNLSTHILLHIQHSKSKISDTIFVGLFYRGIKDENINKLMSEIKFTSSPIRISGIISVERKVR